MILNKIKNIISDFSFVEDVNAFAVQVSDGA